MVKDMQYRVDETPPFFILLLSSIQHVVTLFGSTTLVPLLLGNAMGMNANQIALLISCVYLGTGVSTLVQTHSRLGSGLPIIQGTSFAFIPPILAVVGMHEISSPAVMMQYIGGGLVMGGIVLALVGDLRLARKIKSVITPIVVGPVIVTMGLSMCFGAIDNAAQYWPLSIAVVIMIFIFSLFFKNKYLNIFSILLAVVLAYLACLILSVAGILEQGHPAFVDLTHVKLHPWFRSLDGILTPWGTPKFDPVIIVTMISGFFACMIESIGDYYAVSHVSELDEPDAITISKGICAEGLCCSITGILGATGTTSYTENISLIGLTKNASRNCVRLAAILIVLLSFVGKFSALVTTVPSAIMGGIYLVLFGMITAAGIRALTRAHLDNQRNAMIVGFTLILALGLPGWVGDHKDFFISTEYPLYLQAIGRIVWSILRTPMAVAGITAIACNSIVPSEPRDQIYLY